MADDGTDRARADDRGLELIEIPEMGREISWRDDLIALWKLIQLIRREKPDIVHTHTAKAGTLGRTAAIIALFGRRKKIFHTFHGHVFHSYFSPLKTRVFITIEQVLGYLTHRIIAVSDNTGQELLAYKIARHSKITVIPLGLDLDPFSVCEHHKGELRDELGLSSDHLLIGLVARLVPVKGISYLLEAASCLVQIHPRVRVLIVGDGELRPALEEQVKALGIEDNVVFLGYRKDLPRIYADLDLVVLSSLNEGLPVSIIEAMSSAKVVVATGVGGVPNLISDGLTGFLAPEKDVGGLVTAIERAIVERDQWGDIGAAARAFALSNFHITRLVADMDDLYSGRSRR